MKQYIELLETIKEKGTYKPAARTGMPGTLSRFGHQFRHDLSEGFPLLTTKKLPFKLIVVELLWFLRGDTNIKYLVDNGCNVWNEDAYNYYVKLFQRQKKDEGEESQLGNPIGFDTFVKMVQSEGNLPHYLINNYRWGDCGVQYGKLWRNWEAVDRDVITLNTDQLTPQQVLNFKESWEEALKSNHSPIFIAQNEEFDVTPLYKKTDQFSDLIKGLNENPMGRRHIVTAWNPSTLDQMALNACHAFVQFNCRPLTYKQRLKLYKQQEDIDDDSIFIGASEMTMWGEFNSKNIPQYYLDCQMYQRSADVFLGVPFNIASYALLTQVIAQMVDMLPGEFIHTFGDVHIYDNHVEQVDLQMTRETRSLPTLKFSDEFKDHLIKWREGDVYTFSEFLEMLQPTWFEVQDYDPHPTIKGKLSTGLQ